jgi:hypothetical protein
VNLELSDSFFAIYSNIKFHENLSRGSRVVPWGQTDRHDKANDHLLQFCEHLKINTFEMVEMFQEDVLVH